MTSILLSRVSIYTLSFSRAAAAMEHLSKENNPQVQENNPQVLKVLEVLKQASHDLQTHHSPKSDEPTSPAIKALLELETESDSILSTDTNLSALSHLLSNLKTQVETLHKTRGHSLRSFLTRRASIHSISRLAGSIESEIQAWIDRESIENLSRALQDPSTNDGKLIMLLTQFETRVSQGFNRELQDLILKSKLFALLESTLCNAKTPKHVREYSAFAIAALIRFNKDVFVGQVLMGSAIRALVTMASSSSITVLCSLIKSIKSPLVDEIEFNGEIPKIINFLNSEELEIRIAAMDCVLEMGYYGRKEAVEAMIEEGLIKKLVELQRSELGGDLIDDIGQFEERDSREVNVNGVEGKKVSVFERHPFASCVARFAVQLEVGEGLRQREKRAFKQEILKRVREASLSDAEAATIAAEVLWGSSP